MADGASHAAVAGAAPAREPFGALAAAAACSPLPTLLLGGAAGHHPILFANPAFLAMTGAPEDAVLGRPALEVLGDGAQAPVIAALAEALATGTGGTWPIRLARRDGPPLAAALYLSLLPGPGEHAAHFRIDIVDVGGLTAAPRDQEGIDPAIVENAPGFVAISRGPDHIFSYANAAYRDFVMRGDLVGKTVAEALPEVVTQGFVALLDEVYRTGQPFSGSDLPISITDPETGTIHQRWVDVLYQPVRDAAGAVTGLFCEGHDVTHLHEANQAVAALELKTLHLARVNAMGTMAAALAHELNQPLSAISNYLAGVMPVAGQAPDPARLVMALDGIREASGRAVGIVEHLRLLTRHGKPKREPFSLRPAVAECVQLLSSSCEEQIDFDLRIPDDLIMLAERMRVQQVLINLLRNACEAIAETGKGTVTIDAWKDDRGLTVSVTDTGPGVAPEAVSTLFSWTESAKADGMGIGLSISSSILSLYGGRIWLAATGPGGSEFRFTLPQTLPPQAAEDTGNSR